MNRYQAITLAFILATSAAFVLAWVAYDVWVYARHPEQDATISRVMLLMARKSPLWVVLWVAPIIGAIVHFWGSQDTSQPDDDVERPEPR